MGWFGSKSLIDSLPLYLYLPEIHSSERFPCSRCHWGLMESFSCWVGCCSSNSRIVCPGKHWVLWWCQCHHGSLQDFVSLRLLFRVLFDHGNNSFGLTVDLAVMRAWCNMPDLELLAEVAELPNRKQEPILTWTPCNSRANVHWWQSTILVLLHWLSQLSGNGRCRHQDLNSSSRKVELAEMIMSDNLYWTGCSSWSSYGLVSLLP